MELKVIGHSWIKAGVGSIRGHRGCEKGPNCKAIELDPEAKRHLWGVLRQGVIWLNKPMMSWSYQEGLPGGGQT